MVNILGGFQVIGISAKTTPPAFLEDAPNGIIHDLPGCSTGASHFTDGLLGKDGGDCPPGFLNGAHMTRCGKPQPVTHPRRGFYPQ